MHFRFHSISTLIVSLMELMEGVQHFKIPLEEINLATRNFSDENYIGMGGYGTVYAAKLFLSGQQRTVAIK